MNEKLKRPLPASTTVFLCAAVIAVGILIVFVIFSTEPEAQREAATRKAAMPVDVISAEFGDFQPTLKAMGTVRAVEDLLLRPRVSGQIIERADNFVPGAYVKKGEVLLRIDAADYENALALRRNELVQAQTAYKIEQGEQSMAERDFNRLNKNLDKMQRSLVLREPQLEASQAAVTAAQASLAQAQLDLERTTIRAPFDAQILSREVSVGAQVSQGNVLGRLVGLNSYWVEATLPSDKVQWLPIGSATPVQVRQRNAWPMGEYREGELRSVIAALEENTRMARVLIEVADPLALSSEQQHALAIGSYVECEIPAITLSSVVRLNREYLRKNNTTWVFKDKALSVRELEVVYLDQQYAYVREGLAEGDLIVTTSLSNVRDGAELRLKSEMPATADDMQ